MNNIKIFITYKNRHEIIKSDILTPIQTGRAIAKEKFNEMIGDDTGDNISKDNGKFSELSAVYWVWKNYDKIGNPDYVGFMHYRRQFIFDERLGLPYVPWFSSYYFIPSLDQAKAFFRDESIREMVSTYDYILPKYHVTPTKTIKDEYVMAIPGADPKVFDTFIQVCREIHPDYEEEISQIENGNIVSICNMFVMKKDLFFKYCDFAFPVLFELQNRIDSSHFSTNGLRYIGYMAEKLQTIFSFRLEKNKNLKEKFCNALYIKDTVWPISKVCAEVKKQSLCHTSSKLDERVIYVANNMLYYRLLKGWISLKLLISSTKKRQKYEKKYKLLEYLLTEAYTLKKNTLKI